MKTIYKLAKTELKTLFFSPVAWLILVVLAIQAGVLYLTRLNGQVKLQIMNWPLTSATLGTFAGQRGLFTSMLGYLYLYIPLLTMGIMSRETSSGSIKLLYSSPLTNTQIILGKYLALIIYGLALVGVLGIFSLHAIGIIHAADIPAILTGLLGMYLLICAYAAIGLFMSSLTTYAVVAAIGTLATFAVLNFMKGMWQEIPFVRDITYWLAISGRANTFIAGLLTTEDILYFLLVICLFLGLSILKLQQGRQKSSRGVNIARYAGIVAVTMLIGYFSAKPSLKFVYDSTAMKVNTLTQNSQEVLKKLTDEVTITTYVNMLDQTYSLALPAYYKIDVERFDQYLRFKPEIKMKYVYYYHKANNPFIDKQYPKLSDKQRIDTMAQIYDWDFKIVPYKEIAGEVDLAGEDYRMVRVIERANGKKTFLRVYNDLMQFPAEAEITAAFKRLVTDLPVVGFVTGHGERESNGENDRGYKKFTQEKTFRHALINNGFDFSDVSLDKPVPDSIRILVIAEMKQAMAETEMANLQAYIAGGGNLLIAGEPGRREQMNAVTAQLGVQFMPGVLVKPSTKLQADLLAVKPTGEGIAFSYYLGDMDKNKVVATMPTAAGLSFTEDKGYDVKTLFTSDSTNSWNELETTNFVDDSAICNPAAGESMQPYPVALALSRKVNNREQRIIVTGDADWLSNGELGMSRNVRASNFSLSDASFSWLSDGEAPVDMRREASPDTSLTIRDKGLKTSIIFLRWLLPALLAGIGLIIWIRRRGR